MRAQGWPKAFALALLLALPGAVRADTASERLANSALEYYHKNFGNAIELLKPLLYPAVQLSSEDDIVSAREMLGLSYFYTGQEDLALEEFKALLYLRPRHRLDPFLIPPQAVRFFDQIWSDPAMKEKLEKIEQERAEQERLEAEKKKKQVKTIVRKQYLKQTESLHTRWLAFFPFGIGQFQNGHTTKGVLLATGGGLALTSNIVCWALRVALRNGQGYYGQGEIPVAEGLRVAQFVSLGVFGALWVYGIIDGNLYFEPVTRTPFLPAGEEEEVQPSPAPTLGPAAFQGGGGLVFSGRF